MEKPIKYIRKELRYTSYPEFKNKINLELKTIIEDGYIIHTYNEIETELNNEKQLKVVMLLVKYNNKQIL